MLRQIGNEVRMNTGNIINNRFFNFILFNKKEAIDKWYLQKAKKISNMTKSKPIGSEK